MKNYLLFVASLSALSVCAGVPAESRVVSTPSPGYSLKASPLPYAPLRVNNGGRSAIRNNSGNYAGAPLKARAASLNVAINGYVAYSDNGTDGAPQTPKGMYRIDANGFTNLDATDFSQDIDASYGGTEAGGSYYCAYYWDSQTEEIGLVPFLQQWNTTDWSLTDANFCEPSLLGWDWTYDPVSQRIYGLFTNGSKGVLGIVDTKSKSRTDVGTLDRDFVSIAASADGILYAIDFENGALWTINPVTAATTYVGPTGVKTAFTASACYDSMSGKILWTPTDQSGKSALYAIDPVTAAAEKVMDFPGGEQVLGIYAVAPSALPGYPAAPENLALQFNGGELTGNVTFSIPAANQDGSTSDALSYIVSVDGTQTATDAAGYGQNVSVPVTVAANGMHSFSVKLATSAGEGPAATVRSFIGFGVPQAPVVTLDRQGNVNNVSWTAVTSTVDGGYIDPAAVTYKVVRQPGNTVVAESTASTSLIDQVEAESEFSYFYYDVTALSAGQVSATAHSNRFDSGHITPPYLQPFDDASALADFNIIDSNDDKIVWVIDGQAAYLKYNSQKAADDWLITPPIVLEAGKMYRISADVKGRSSRYEEKFSIWLGTEPTVDGMTTPIVPETGVSSDSFTDYGDYISVPVSGLYFVGVHGTSDKNKYALIVDNLSVSAPTSMDAPGQVTDIVAVPSPDGSASATVSFKAPSVNLAGTALTEITTLTVSRGEETVKSFSNPQPGETLSFTATAADEGEYAFTAVAENTTGTGKPVSFSVYLGVNVPGNPTNIVASEPKTGTATITWDAPATDADGNPINADLISYTIYRPNEDGYMVALVKDLKETTYTYIARPTSVEQAFETYGVQAKTRRGVSSIMRSRTIPLGTPYTLPYTESYRNGYAHNISSVQFITGGEWNIYDDSTLAGLQSVDGDGGFTAMFSNISTEKSMLHTGKIDLGEAANPLLSFYTYNIVARDPDSGEVVGALDQNKLEVLVNDRTEGFKTVMEVSMDQLPSEGWNRLTVDLTPYKGKVIELGFSATTVNKQYTLLDDIRVFDQHPHNLTLASVSAPAKVQPNVPFEVSATVENNGANPTGAYTVELTRNGAVVASTEGVRLESGARTVCVFPQTLNVTEDENHEYAANVVYDADNFADDNTGKKASTLLVHSKVPVPMNLTGSANKSAVTLAWDEPDLNVVVADEVTEDFESYESFITDNIGDWTVIDADGLPIGNMNSIGMPGITSGAFLSWFVNDASLPGWNNSISANSGNKFIATVYSTGGANDDWIISPRLSGTAQTVTFYARSYNTRYLEAMQMMYSSTDKELESFTRVKEIPNVSATWKLYSFELPEGAEYFAIRCVSDDCAMLFVDDITYAPYKEALMQVDGYNIYRDGVRVNGDPAADRTYVDNVRLEDVAKTYSYAVSALYGQTESRASVPVTVAVESGIAGVGAAQVKVTATPGMITLTGAAGAHYAVYDLSGRTIASSVASSATTIPVAPGVYLVKVSGTLTKLLVP